jgi:cytoskeletal protein RodZ
VTQENQQSRISVGDLLRKEREVRGVALESISQETRIRVDYLRGIEQGEWSNLPANVYVRGYIRAYTQFLGVEAEPFLKRHAEQAPAPPASPFDAVRLQANPVLSAPAGASAGSGAQERGMRPAATGGQRNAHPPRRLSVVLTLVVLLLTALTIGVMYYVNRPDGQSPSTSKPSTTETTSFEVNS